MRFIITAQASADSLKWGNGNGDILSFCEVKAIDESSR